ncbi:hypothetical protein KUTeg_006483, partial [Tegillarca granosa]
MADREILNVIPPVVLQEDCKLLQAVVPLIPGKENAPPYNCPVYISIPHPGLDIENVSFDMIYQFMIDRKRQTADTGNVSVNSFKALDRAVSHFQAGDVSEVMAAEVTYFIYHIVYVCETRTHYRLSFNVSIECGIMYVKARVKASMKKKQYTAWICFLNGRPIHAYCQCPIGLAQCCSHVGSILFFLNDYTRQKSQIDMQLPCTSKPAAWKKPRKMNLDPKPINQLEFKKPKLSAAEPKPSSFEFDPRHTNDKNFKPDYYQQKLMELKKIFPKTDCTIIVMSGMGQLGMSHLCQIYEDTPPVASIQEVETLIDPIDMEINMMIHSATNRPPQQIGQDLVEAIEKRTREQRNCSLWLDLHKGRLTSSRFGDIMSSGECPKSLVSEIVNGSSLFGHTITVKKCGLFLIPYAPYIGASCDGIVTDTSLPKDVQRGVLEIKCPFSSLNSLLLFTGYDAVIHIP